MDRIAAPLIFLIVSLLAIVAVANLVSEGGTVINLSGRIVPGQGLGIFSDLNCSRELTFIDWGNLTPGDSRDRSFFVRNEGGQNSTIQKREDNWAPPEAAEFLEVSWNYDNRSMTLQEVLEVTLTLSVAADIQGISQFSFDIHLAAVD